MPIPPSFATGDDMSNVRSVVFHRSIIAKGTHEHQGTKMGDPWGDQQKKVINQSLNFISSGFLVPDDQKMEISARNLCKAGVHASNPYIEETF
ncbi:hypothetical protein GPJ56_000307 [Histomonas meleagridis]|nr:hypothetical protein GPJ56_000307 [Histomonas meleagridis]